MKKLHTNQHGIVSFMVVMVIMIVLSLIVLAFAKLVNREQSQTLDRQLNSQAFYAAESGVNEAREQLAANPALANQDYNECTGANSFPSVAGINPVLDGPGGVVSYSCLLVDPSPRELTYSNVPMNESIAFPLRTKGGQPITRLQVSWEDSAGQTNVAGCPAAGTYPATWPANCQVGILRLEIVPFQGARNRDQLITTKGVVFISPRQSGGAPTINYGNMSGDQQGGRHNGVCTGGGPGPRLCSVEINSFGANQFNDGFMRMRSIYRATAVTIRAFNGSTQLELVDAQAEVDVTGRASDVLKRVKMAVPVGEAPDNTPNSEYALQVSRGICKVTDVGPTFYDVVWLDRSNTTICHPQQIRN